jgi:hypothetical protein
MIRKRAELDTKNPPGQIVNRPRYLRDVIARIDAEERYKALTTFEKEVLGRVKFLEAENARLKAQIVKDRERFGCHPSTCGGTSCNSTYHWCEAESADDEEGG